MGVKELLQRLGEKGKARKELLRRMDEQVRMERIVEERQLSSNEREMNQLDNENREERIKERLQQLRKIKDQDIKFGHNPLDTKNITNHTEWEVMKERNMFKNNSNMFEGQQSVLRNNKKLLHTNKKLLKGGNMFKI